MNFVAGSPGSVRATRGGRSASTAPTERNCPGSSPPRGYIPSAGWCSCSQGAAVLTAQPLRTARKATRWPAHAKKPALLTFSSSSPRPAARELPRRFSACQKRALRNTACCLQRKQKRRQKLYRCPLTGYACKTVRRNGCTHPSQEAGKQSCGLQG